MIEITKRKTFYQIWEISFSIMFMFVLILMIFNIVKVSLISDKLSNMIARGINVTDKLKDTSGLMAALKAMAVLHTFVLIVIVIGVLSIVYILYKKSIVNDMYNMVKSMGFLTFVTALFAATIASGMLSTPVFMIKQAFHVSKGRLSWEGIPELFDIGIRMHGDSIVRVALAFVLYIVALSMAGFYIILEMIGKTDAMTLQEVLDEINCSEIKKMNREIMKNVQE